MIIEVIVENVTDAMEAEKAGANRLELVSAFSEGGLTPSYGTIKQVLANVSIPVHVMLRPHSYSFSYSKNDAKVIMEDLLSMKELGVKGIVFGCLTEKMEIDEDLLHEVVAIANDMSITFHRAFDEATDKAGAYQTLTSIEKIDRILTSGGAPNVEAGLSPLKQLIELSQQLNGPIIMPGSGLTFSNFKEIHNLLGSTEYHFGSGVRRGNSLANPIDVNKLTKITNLSRTKGDH